MWSSKATDKRELLTAYRAGAMEEVVGKATEVEKGLACIGVCGATPDPFSEHRESHYKSI